MGLDFLRRFKSLSFPSQKLTTGCSIYENNQEKITQAEFKRGVGRKKVRSPYDKFSTAVFYLCVYIFRIWWILLKIPQSEKSGQTGYLNLMQTGRELYRGRIDKFCLFCVSLWPLISVFSACLFQFTVYRPTSAISDLPQFCHWPRRSFPS